jgi:hypothetical protein
MARVSKGDSLGELVLQPGWTIEEDGFGLLTSRLTFVTSHGSGDFSSPKGNKPNRGDAHPKDVRLTCHRATETFNSNGLSVVVAEYIGIAKGNSTSPEVTGRGNMSTDPITTHKDFVKTIGGTKDAPKNGAIFDENTELFINFGTVPEGTPSTAENPGGGGSIAGWIKRGVRSYLNPGFGISGHFYTSNFGVASALKQQMGKSSSTGKYAGINLLGGLAGLGSSDSIWGTWSSNEEVPQLLLTGLAIDFYGTLIKVSYDITFAKDGWDYQIYEPIS